MNPIPTVFDLSRPGSGPLRLPAPEEGPSIPTSMLREELLLLEVGELELVRHYQRLGRLDTSPEIAPQLTGSCTMKYNPKISEMIAELPGLRDIHPYQPEETLQGALTLLWEMQRHLQELSGLPGVALQPASGAQGMLAGLLMIRAFHTERGEGSRNVVIVTDSAHGSNPATATMCGCTVRTLRSRPDGQLDLEHFDTLLDEHVAAVMLTQPNTAGVYVREVEELARRTHAVGALLYMDGANMNALAGIVRPAELGVDVMQINLHKTFATPHGGSGPGSGPVLCREELAPYLPLPIVERVELEGAVRYRWVTERPGSIGRVRSFAGNWSVIVRAYVFMRLLGPDGIVQATEQAVLSANYVRHLLGTVAPLPLEGPCAHEVVFSAAALHEVGVGIEDVAKRLMDYGFHPPLYNFPKHVPEAMLIEPTESESKHELERFAAALAEVWREAYETPSLVSAAPHGTPIGRVFDQEA